MTTKLNVERQRLEAQHEGREDWRMWGPYLAERAWGTVREDYSAGGTAWEYFDHDQSRSRAYRWNEDGIGGICDEHQRLCFALALWNGKDPILKERMFGLTGNQGNHGEDVKEFYFYMDATPSHSWMRYLYKYPQAEYPYGSLVRENAMRSRQDPPFNLLDTGVFEDNRYFDVEVRYAKAGPDEIHIRIIATNHGPEAAPLHLLPQLWFRNDWSWGDPVDKPALRNIAAPMGAQWAVQADHPTLGTYYLYGRHAAQVLYTENESNAERLWNAPSASPYVKDAFHRRIVNDEHGAVNPELTGTKFGAWHVATIEPRYSTTIGMTLSRQPLKDPFGKREVIFAKREAEATVFYDELLPDGDTQDMNILRQSLAGMIWSKQFFHFDVELAGRRPACSTGRSQIRPQSPLAPHEGGACRLDAGQMGIPVVRGMGPGIPLWRAGAGGCGFRQGADRTPAHRALPASEWTDPGIRMVLRRRQSSGAGDGGAEGIPRRAGTARRRRHWFPAARDA